MKYYESKIAKNLFIGNNKVKDIQINYANLTSLEGCPKEIQGNFLCNENLLESLKHLAKKISGEVQISKNYLTYTFGNKKSGKFKTNKHANNKKTK